MCRLSMMPAPIFCINPQDILSLHNAYWRKRLILPGKSSDRPVEEDENGTMPEKPSDKPAKDENGKNSHGNGTSDGTLDSHPEADGFNPLQSSLSVSTPQVLSLDPNASPEEKDMIIEAARRATGRNLRFFPGESSDDTDDDSDNISQYAADRADDGSEYDSDAVTDRSESSDSESRYSDEEPTMNPGPGVVMSPI
ncbi:hypothetical protein V8E54_011972 [Elaphomyces granulatus]